LNLIDDIKFDVRRVVIGDVSLRIAAFWRWVIRDPAALSARFDDLLKPFDDAMARLGARRDVFHDFTWFGSLKDGNPETETERYKRVGATRRELFELFQLLRSGEGDELTQAARIALLHNLGYSGIAHSSGISYSCAAKTRVGSKLEVYGQASRLLRRVNAEVVCGDFEETCAKVTDERRAFIYLDPPYFNQGLCLYGSGLADETFSHTRCADYLCSLPDSVSFLLSYDDSVAIRSLYSGKPGVTVEAYRLPGVYRIGSGGRDTALDGEELLIYNYAV
jgi:site-specific DNA-adenine methylase